MLAGGGSGKVGQEKGDGEKGKGGNRQGSMKEAGRWARRKGTESREREAGRCDTRGSADRSPLLRGSGKAVAERRKANAAWRREPLLLPSFFLIPIFSPQTDETLLRFLSIGLQPSTGLSPLSVRHSTIRKEQSHDCRRRGYCGWDAKLGWVEVSGEPW